MSFHYSTDDWSLLYEMLAKDYPDDFLTHQVKTLAMYGTPDHLSELYPITCAAKFIQGYMTFYGIGDALYGPLEDVPPHVHGPIPLIALICKWRLLIGK